MAEATGEPTGEASSGRLVDWRGSGMTAAQQYRRMAEYELIDVSPTYARLCLGVSEDADVLGLIEELPRPKQQPNLLLGSVRLLGGPIDDYDAFRTFVLDRRDDLLATMRERSTQTNEPLRCASLLPVLAALPQPLALIEVGASAGLCLLPDRYRYRYEGDGIEHVVGDGSVELRCAVSGPVPLPSAVPTVVWRRGLDLNPLDVSDDEDVRWLECLIWPEETERFGRLRDAVALARTDPPTVVTGNLETDLRALIDQAPPDATLVVFHSAVLAYVDTDARAAFADRMRALAAERGVVWVSNEGPNVVPNTPVAGDEPTFVLARDGVPVALADGHGYSLRWLS